MERDEAMPGEGLTASIDRQIAFNRRKNLYHTGRETIFAFNGTTRAIIDRRDELQRILRADGAEAIIDYAARRALKEFYRSNQYIDIREPDIENLRGLYRRLADDILSDEYSAELIAKRHYERLAGWLASAAPITQRINPPERPTIREAVCAEYSPELQLRILGIDPEKLIEPVIDVGCGEHAALVIYLRERGIEAYGIDRSCDGMVPYLFAKSWFEFDFIPNRWGTITSNLSFSTHFLNNHLLGDGGHIAYAAKYMELLNSLRPGGAWHYAPSIPFIEEHLPGERFIVEREKIDEEFSRTVVRRANRF